MFLLVNSHQSQSSVEFSMKNLSVQGLTTIYLLWSYYAPKGMSSCAQAEDNTIINVIHVRPMIVKQVEWILYVCQFVLYTCTHKHYKGVAIPLGPIKPTNASMPEHDGHHSVDGIFKSVYWEMICRAAWTGTDVCSYQCFYRYLFLRNKLNIVMFRVHQAVLNRFMSHIFITCTKYLITVILIGADLLLTLRLSHTFTQWVISGLLTGFPHIRHESIT